MPLWKNTQHSFAAGQLDTHVMGRQDMDKYAHGATLLKNFVVKRQGCISKRRGTDLTADLANLLGNTYAGDPIVPDKMRLVPVVNDDDGRYVILSGGVGFVASRDGVLTSDLRHVRANDPYTAVDADGKPVVITGKDVRYSTETPFDVIHRVSAGNYSVARYATFQAAFNAAADGDVVRLHSNVAVKSAVTVTRSNVWKTDADASATVTWDGDHDNHPNQYKIVTGGQTYYSRESDGSGNRSTVTFEANSEIVTVTEQPKTVTLDLYGYKITILSSNGFYIRPASVTLVVDSARVGGKIVVMGSGNACGFYVDAQVTGLRSGAIRFVGDVEYDLYTNSPSWIVRAYETSGLTVERGTFTVHAFQNNIFHVIGGALVVNGGTFRGTPTGNGYVQLVALTHNTGSVLPSTATINGGVFENASGYIGGNDFYNSCIFKNGGGSVLINGGRFTFASSANFCTQATPRGHTYWYFGYLRIVRGEFSCASIRDHWDTQDYAVDLYTGDHGDTSDRAATEIHFARLDITATASAWTFSDPSESLACEWNGYVSKWRLYGTDSQGRTINEYLEGGAPADTELTFPSSGITATRTWTFSDGGSWPIGYGGGSWYMTNSAPNATQPGADGFYGVKLGTDLTDYSYGVSTEKTPYRFAVPYADEHLADLCIRQSGDTLFIAHRNYPPAKIYFDSKGRAYFEELTLDNTDHQPPVVESATMDGNDPQEADWPSEFPYKNAQNNWVTTGVPGWIKDSTDEVPLNGSNKTPLNHLKDFVLACKALGTVTDAGYSGNEASSADDGSYSRAGSFTCTSVNKNLSTGRKETTVSVISFTASRTVEVTTQFVDGQERSSTPREIDTVGVASNSASAASALVPRTVRYVATYVKDGRESRPSVPVTVEYDMPWANNAVVNITVGKGANGSEPDYYNVYKDNGNGFGLIATVGVDRIAGGVAGAIDTYPLFMPDNSRGEATLACAADYEERKGWSVGDIMRKMVSTGKDIFTSSPQNDICLLTTASNSARGIVMDFETPARFNRVRVMLDGRLYDKANDASYIIVSTNMVTCTCTYLKTDGTTGTFYKTMSSAQGYSWGGISGGVMIGIYEDWVSLPFRAFTTPNGDTVYGWLYGRGDCTEEFNAHLRYIDFDFKSTIDGLADFAGIKSAAFTFYQSVYDYWYPNNQQGCIHAVHFYSGDATGDAGVVQDDYINPDMTVTPPDDTRDAHFSAAGDYPGCVGLYFQRLVFASTANDPSTIWMSRVADLYNFTTHESIREDDALELTLAATEFPKLNHLVAGRDLMLFGDGGEWLVAPLQGNALTYKTASAKLQSMVGSDRAVQPLQLADETLFAERGGTSLRSINYNYTSDSYQSQDLSVIAQSIFRANPIVSMAYKQHPDSIVECVLADGRVATLVYMKEQEVAAWSVQELGGGWKAKEIVTPKCIVDGTTEMMLLVEKNGAYQLWRVRNDNDAPVDANQVVLDGLHVETSSAPTGTGEIGVALGDGTYAVGWEVVAEMVTVRPEPERAETMQMEVKNATESEIRVIGASSFKVKPYAIDTGWRDVTLPVVRDGSAVTLAEKDCKRLLTGTNNRDGRIHVKHVEPWPITILSISNTYQVEYENGGREQ